MAQVYQFVDDNGVTRLFAEIQPDPAGTPFNGGTITTGLTVQDGDAVAYETLLKAAVTEGTVFQVDGGGEVFIKQQDAGATPLVVVDMNNGEMFYCGPDSSVVLNSGIVQTDISAGAKLGFFSAPAVAKPAVTGAKLPSDTVMASLLTALDALGLVTDSTT
jgi:hypothetical protein